MAFRKVSYLIPSCDGCGLVWSFFDLACADGIPPHFADRRTALDRLPLDYGWEVRSYWFGFRLMACRKCAAGGVIPAGTFGALQLAAVRWVRRLVPFGPIRRPLPPGPEGGHPESLTGKLRPEDEELLAAIEDEDFPQS